MLDSVRLGRYLELVAQATQLLLQLRDKPRPLDYLAIGTNAIHLGYEVRQEFALRNRNHEEYFEAEGWVQLPDASVKLVEPALSAPRRIEPIDMFDREVLAADLGEVEVFWIAHLLDKTHQRCSSYFYKQESLPALQRALATAIHAKVGSRHVRFSEEGLSADDLSLPDGYVQTALVRKLLKRVRAFLNVGINRAYLVNGAPGTGKSVAFKSIVDQLGMSSLRIEGRSTSGPGVQASELGLDLLLSSLRPEVVIIDDIDWLDGDRWLLSLLEQLHLTSKVVLASCNNKDWLSAPLLRPGRFDDHFDAPRLDAAVVEQMLGQADNPELIEAMRDWPVAYIHDYTHRVHALGNATADAEIDDLQTRIDDYNAEDRAEDT